MLNVLIGSLPVANVAFIKIQLHDLKVGEKLMQGIK